jgi:outer membrane protein OmpA-like peptidoglycan-associated protein
MKSMTLAVTPILVAVALLVSACSTTPRTTSQLDQTRSDYIAAQNNPNIAHYAPLEMQQAGVAMNDANMAASRDDSTDKINNLAYIAQQKIAVAQEVGKQKYAEAEIARSAKERDQMRLDQRTNEADQAKNSAAQSKVTADIAVDNAAEADRNMREAQRVTAETQAHATLLQSQLDDLAAKKTDRGIVITLGDVLFGVDQAHLSPDGMRKTQKLADVLQQNPQRSVLVEGYADSTGNAQHNQELSERRAMAVRDALSGMGIANNRVATRGYGQDFPVASNDTSSNRQLNRRVEIVLSDDTGKISQR